MEARQLRGSLCKMEGDVAHGKTGGECNSVHLGSSACIIFHFYQISISDISISGIAFFRSQTIVFIDC